MPRQMLTTLLHRMSNDAITLRRYVLDYEISTVTSIYLTYTATARNSSRKTIGDALERMDADYESISGFAQEISRIEHTLRQRRAALRNFLQPVAALPMEVLQRIFLYAIQPEKYFGDQRHLPSPITLSQVCSTWRHAGQSYPPIWTVVRLESCEHYPYMPYARYSGDLPLELHEQRPCDRRGMVVGLEGADVQGRITGLSLPLDRHFWIALSDDFPEEGALLNYGSIERLSLFASDEGVEDRLGYREPLTQFHSLRHLFLEHIFIRLSSTQLANLVTLVLSWIHLDGIEFSEFIDACVSIQELTLDAPSIFWSDDDATAGQKLIPSLHTLSVLNLDCHAAFLSRYRMPQLRSFTLSIGYMGDSDIVITSANTSDFIADTPTIKAMNLQCRIEDLICVLERLWLHSHLEHDNLPGCTDLTISVRGSELPLEGINYVQHLIKVYLEGCQAESRPLQTLTVPRLIFEDDVDWVRSRVPELTLTD